MDLSGLLIRKGKGTISLVRLVQNFITHKNVMYRHLPKVEILQTLPIHLGSKCSRESETSTSKDNDLALSSSHAFNMFESSRYLLAAAQHGK